MDRDAEIWTNVVGGLVANALWFCVTAFFASAYFLRKDRSKFTGRWKSEITWTAVWARQMLLGTDPTDPHSEGELALSYGSGVRKNQYWGLSFWRLRDGTRSLAELCVELRGIEMKRGWTARPPFVSYRLVRARLSSRIRREFEGFKYAADFANYEIVFTDSTEQCIVGTVRAVPPNETVQVAVGAFTAERMA